ncbi:DUF3043 domain-containing protein [Cellulomonas sp. HZM]|uniref:DUF3043 domain-containing protein n=1 Tax=Cellulomonas sp. HZM TaxID=1454010 RepID=UPI0004934D84|nr:DUF3043 domain-containing protein [Cellulomonas sp. HZM]
MPGREKTPADAADVTAAATSDEQPQAGGKGRPTPKRKDAEAANKRPLVPADRKQAGKASKSAAREARNSEYRAMQTGDINNMPPAHRGPVRTFVRDWVDGRFNLGEFFLPVAAVFLVLQITLASASPNLAALAMLVLYVYVIAALVDAYILWRGLRKALRAKFGENQPLKGLALYAIMRAFQLRPTRLPKARNKRGVKPV